MTFSGAHGLGFGRAADVRAFLYSVIDSVVRPSSAGGAALFFVKFWRKSLDRFFLLFALIVFAIGVKNGN